jgi:hypothetical protein
MGGRIADSRAAFAWGYLDLIDPDGNGVVLIWGYANPFVPGTVSRCRRGTPPLPADEPSIAVSVYEKGRPAFYLLQRLPAVGSADPFDEDGIDLEGVQVRFAPGRVEVALDLPTPGGERLVGTVSMEGRAPDLPLSSPQSHHRWGPRLLGEGQASLHAGPWRFAMRGRGYHDGNVSARSLDALGIDGWVWGRVPFPDGDWIYYLVQGAHEDLQVHLSLFVHRDGRVDLLPGELIADTPRRSFWGVRHSPRFVVDGYAVHVDHLVDDGPFYLRMETLVEGPAGRARGVGEVVHVPSMDAGALALLTPMAVHDPTRGSWWSPLFSGPARGRVRRLLRHWVGR